jgi:hypothetical protein
MPNFDDMLSTTKGTKVPASTLLLMSKEASRAYLDHQTPLNDSIVKMAQQHPEWSGEHIRRIIEAANQETYAELFNKEASSVKNIVYDLADPDIVLPQLEKEARAHVTLPADAAYDRPIMDFHDGLLDDAEGDAILANAFGIPAAQEKVAAAVGPTIHDWDQALGALDHVRAEAGGVERMHEDVVIDFNHQVKQAMLEGYDLGEVGVVMEGMLGEKTAMLRPYLVDAVRRTLEAAPDVQVEADPEKTAAAQTRVVDPASPLAVVTQQLHAVASRRTLLKHAEGILTDKVKELRAALT